MIYSDGIRVILVIDRSKNNKARFVTKYISKNPEDYEKKVARAVAEAKILGCRVYATVNPRDVNKAIRLFKQRQLDADYYAEEDKHRFYLDMRNSWISALMNPASRADNLFLLDCDTDDEYNQAMDKLAELDIPLVDERATAKGHHLITRPFNPALMGEKLAPLIKKDHLILLYHWLKEEQ